MAEKIIPLTLAIPVEGGRVLLGLKKRGFGIGKWNGFGGKLESGETIEEAARRETFEECGIEITEMEEAGIHEFRFEEKPDEMLEVHVYRVKKYRGQPFETEEMKPQWFEFDKIPFERMWLDDKYWFPLFLTGKKFKGKFLFNRDGGEILEHSLQEL